MAFPGRLGKIVFGSDGAGTGSVIGGVAIHADPRTIMLSSSDSSPSFGSTMNC